MIARSAAMGALFVGLILLCLNSVVMVINKTFASPQSLNDEQFSVGTTTIHYPSTLTRIFKSSVSFVSSDTIPRRGRGIQAFIFR